MKIVYSFETIKNLILENRSLAEADLEYFFEKFKLENSYYDLDSFIKVAHTILDLYE